MLAAGPACSGEAPAYDAGEGCGVECDELSTTTSPAATTSTTAATTATTGATGSGTASATSAASSTGTSTGGPSGTTAGDGSGGATNATSDTATSGTATSDTATSDTATSDTATSDTATASTGIGGSTSTTAPTSDTTTASATGASTTTTGGTTSTTTGGAGECTGPETPPSEYQETIDLTWTEMTGGFDGATGARPPGASVENFRNLILDQLFAADGALRFCVRWESTETVSQAMRDQIAEALERGANEWFEKLAGYDCFPFGHVPVLVTGWATADRNLLEWSDDTVRVDVGDFREGAPQCQEACGRFFHQQEGYTYPECPGGFDAHYDMSLWLTQGMSGGAGGDWGQRVGSEYFTGSVTNDHQHIWLHEFGHGLGFPDYYNWDEWAPGIEGPNSVMVAGRASLVTEWDTWMVRHLWSELKPRWQ